jgi:hypothetical protein
VQVTFPPFADDELGQQLSAVLVIRWVEQRFDASPIQGNWRLPFMITPDAPHSLTPSPSPEVHHGLGLQIARADWVSDASPSASDVRLRLRFSPSPADVILNPSEFSAEILNASLGNFAFLQLPNGQSLKPQAFYYRTYDVSMSGSDVFLHEKTFQGTIDFVNTLTPLPSGTHATLHVAQVPAQNTQNFTEMVIAGPWDLSVPA